MTSTPPATYLGATPEQLTAWLGVDALDDARALLVLAVAADHVRAYTRQVLDPVTDDVVIFRPTRHGQTIYLPQAPVTELVSVEQSSDNGTTWEVITTPLVVTGQGVLTRASSFITAWPSAVRVTYNHGFDTMPGDLTAVVLAMAGRLYANPVGLTAESLGSRSAQYGTAGPMLTGLEQDVLARYMLGSI